MRGSCIEELKPDAEPVDRTRVSELPSSTGTGTTCVLLRIAAGRYAFAASAVGEVAGMLPMTRMPDTPTWVAGVANWRGRVLPVLDLRPLLGIEVTALGSSARVIVLVRGPLRAGVLTDAVTEVSDLELDGAVSGPATVNGAAAALVPSQVVTASGPLAIFDADAVLALGRLLRSDRDAAGDPFSARADPSRTAARG